MVARWRSVVRRFTRAARPRRPTRTRVLPDVCAGGRALEHPERRPVSDSGLSEWKALRRVHNGGIAKSAGAYVDHGRPTPAHLAGVFDQLIWTELVRVADGDPVWELRRLSLTDAGTGRYTALGEQLQRSGPREQRQTDLVVPAPEHGTQTPEGYL